MTRRVRLRRWQKEALERFDTAAGRDFLAVATPGAGKTTFALTAAVRQLASSGGPRRLVVVAPTAHLKRQWAAAAVPFGLHLDHRWSPSQGRLAGDMHGIVTTYQQVAWGAPQLARLAPQSMVVFDEIHHAGDERAWGSSIRQAFDDAALRLSLSGTPFRSDTRSIPFVRYHLDEAQPDYEFGYGDALANGRVVRPVYFPRIGGHMEWSAADGSAWAATFDDALDTVRANQRLRAALSLDGEWLPAVLRVADRRLEELRRHHPDAGGLVIATDQDHARAVAHTLARRHGVRPVLAVSDDAAASERIAAFGASRQPWLVSVRMVSEGVDIPRLRVGVYATTTTTELFFRQAVGRLVRWTPGLAAQPAYLFIPDDPRLRGWAQRIAETRRHSLRRDDPEPADTAPEPLDPPAEEPADDHQQLSLFAVISAVATDLHDPAEHLAGAHLAAASPDPAGGAEPGAEEDLLVDLPPLAGPADGPPTDSADGVPPTPGDHKRRLRRANAEVARALVHKTGWTHAKVNAELNRRAGIRRVTEATLEQLQRRLRHAEHWHTTA